MACGIDRVWIEDGGTFSADGAAQALIKAPVIINKVKQAVRAMFIPSLIIERIRIKLFIGQGVKQIKGNLPRLMQR
ncbi:MAG TPA: hypothetical protein VK138_09895 [Acidiferrobacterales bacterium]|nr:hypothetical protein [Acidiferrobacterales bacterium]